MSKKSKFGKVCRFDVYADDVTRAKNFYSELFNWKFQSFGAPDMWMIAHEGDEVGGMISKRSYGRPTGQGTLIYFEVEDIDQTLTRAQKLGGKTTVPKTLIAEQVGSFAVLDDSEGNSIAIYRSAQT